LVALFTKTDVRLGRDITLSYHDLGHMHELSVYIWLDKKLVSAIRLRPNNLCVSPCGYYVFNRNDDDKSIIIQFARTYMDVCIGERVYTVRIKDKPPAYNESDSVAPKEA
jgi:hypothetical protein